MSAAEWAAAVARAAETSTPVDRALEELAESNPRREAERLRSAAARIREGVPLDQALGSGFPGRLMTLCRDGASLAALMRRIESRERLNERIQSLWRRLRLKLILTTGVAAALAAVLFGALDLGGTLRESHELFGGGAGPISPLLLLLILLLPLLGAAGAAWLLHRPSLIRWAKWIPLWGRVLKNDDLFSFAFGLSIELKSGGALSDALRHVGPSIRDLRMRREIEEAAARVDEGSSLFEAIHSGPVFPRMLCWSAHIGEPRGNLPDTLEDLGSLYARSRDRALQSVEGLLPTIGIILMGLVVLSWALAVLHPISVFGQEMMGYLDAGALGAPIFVAYGGILAFAATIAGVLIYAHRKKLLFESIVDHLATAVARGLPLAPVLEAAARDHRGLSPSSLMEVARQVQAGTPLGEAFRRAAWSIPAPIRNAVSVGEAGGNLGPALADLRELYRSRREEGELLPRAAMVYQLVVTTLLLVLINFPIAGMGPLFAELKLSPSPASIGTASWICGILFWFATMVALSALVGPGRHWDAPAPGPNALLLLPVHTIRKVCSILLAGSRAMVSGSALRLPALRDIARAESIRHVASSLSILLKSGGSLEECFEIVSTLDMDGPLRKSLSRIRSGLGEGRRLSELIASESTWPREFAALVRLGEAGGNLPSALGQASVLFGARARAARAALARMAIPVLILLNGLLLLGACALLLFPLFEYERTIAEWASWPRR
jgi:type II secretory pathway component PulF